MSITVFLLIHLFVGLFMIYSHNHIPKPLATFFIVFFVMSGLYWSVFLVDYFILSGIMR